MIKNNCIQFKNSTDTSGQELYFYGDIVSDQCCKWSDTDTCPQDIQDILNQIDGNKPLNIYINSGGGSVFAGLAIYNMLKRCPAQKTVYVDGLAASIASVIAMAGDKIVMPSNAFLMIHKASNIAMGNADDMRKMADDLDKIDEGILNVYADNIKDGVDINDIKSMVDSEKWLTGDDAAKYFNIDVTKSNKAAASIGDLSNYKNVPQELVKASTEPDNSAAELEIVKAKLALELI